ncbi:LysR family transcriptional regulator [Parapusillimonas granuli]|uniref:LysR family transcriptional regulator n=1 Tax=Parapusillimonas granuli TaxID=380911 RepID=A0A853G5U1_9BURK|nr:LysR family transcriptional regulator [Parapusillimonas granuli]MBB5215376.1 DNA-binding transcriptional LysR family regulator [Parapusillimonas granuli]NYT49956.1 LysR family transcriptional regulator [Parapusillimonas granuli]
MDLNSLHFFIDIVDAGSLSAAARKRNMSRANLSYRLKAFEDALGAQLLRRTTKSMQLTEIGAAVYKHGRNMLQELAAVNDVVSSAAGSVSGHVRLSVSAGLGHLALSDTLVRFRRDHPGVTFDVVFSNQISNLVEEGIDIALRVLSRPPANSMAVELADVDWVVCSSPEYMRGRPPIHVLEDLQRLDIVCASAVGAALSVTGRYAGGSRSVELDPVLRSDNFVFLKQAVMEGGGVGFLPRYMLRDELESGRLVRHLEYYRISVFGAKIFLLTPPTRYQTAAARALIQALKARLCNEALYVN